MEKKVKKDPETLEKIGLFTAKEAWRKKRVSQPTLSRWVKSGSIERVARGFYLHPDSDFDPVTLDFSVACAKFGPHSAIGGLSALYHYGLIEQAPNQVWISIPAKRIGRNPFYRCLRTKMSPDIGIVTNGNYRITTVERALFEAMKFGSKIGPRVAINAVRRALKEGKTTELKLGQMAKRLKLRPVLEKYWEAIVE